MTDISDLLSARAVRERAHQLLALGLADKLPHFRIDLGQLDTIADLVLDVTSKPPGTIEWE